MCLCKLLRRSGYMCLCKLLRRWLGRGATTHIVHCSAPRRCLKECLPQIGVVLLIAQLAALLRWDVPDKTLCHQVLQVPTQSLFRYPDVYGKGSVLSIATVSTTLSATSRSTPSVSSPASNRSKLRPSRPVPSAPWTTSISVVYLWRSTGLADALPANRCG
jgi:hypothetical protein